MANITHMLNILYAKRDKDSKAFCREGSKRIDFTNTKRQCRVKSVELLKLQYTELTHIPTATPQANMEKMNCLKDSPKNIASV